MQKLVVVSEYCTRKAGSDCARCGYICPHGAITLLEGAYAPVVDHDLCTGCGLCFGICDAFASTQITMLDLHARIRRIGASGRTVHLTCEEDIFPGLEPDSNVVVLPCLSMIPPTMWTLLLAEDLSLSITHDLSYCDGCTRAGDLGGMLFPRAIEVAQERTGREVSFSDRIPEKQRMVEKYTGNAEPTDRRALFTGAANDVIDIASGDYRRRNNDVLADFYARRERMRATLRLNIAEEDTFDDFTPEGQRKHTMMPSHKLLLEAIERQHDIAPKIDVMISRTDTSRCIACGACLDACPTGARTISDGHIYVDPLYCIGCGICVDTCPHGAASVEGDTAEIYLKRLESVPRSVI